MAYNASTKRNSYNSKSQKMWWCAGVFIYYLLNIAVARSRFIWSYKNVMLSSRSCVCVCVDKQWYLMVLHLKLAASTPSGYFFHSDNKKFIKKTWREIAMCSIRIRKCGIIGSESILDNNRILVNLLFLRANPIH